MLVVRFQNIDGTINLSQRFIRGINIRITLIIFIVGHIIVDTVFGLDLARACSRPRR